MPETLMGLLATAILEDESGDMLDRVEEAKLILPEPAFNDLCAMLEVCPLHTCDDQICRDDGVAECAVFQLEATCGKCGETFVPSDETDTIHLLTVSTETECGGQGTITGEWRI